MKAALALIGGLLAAAAMAMAGKPAAPAAVRPAAPTRATAMLAVELRDGTRVKGRTTLETLTVSCPYGKLNVRVADIRGIVVERLSAGGETWQQLKLEMRNGDRLTGRPAVKKLDVETPYGKLSVPLADVARVEVSVLPPEAVQAGAEAPCLLVAGYRSDNICRFDAATGAYAGQVVAARFGGLDGAEEMLIAPDGNLLVASVVTSSVKKYNLKTGAYMGDFAVGGEMRWPRAMRFGPDGNLYVSVEGGRILRYNGQTGAFIDTFVPAGILAGSCHGMVFRDGCLYLANGDGNNVVRFDASTGKCLGVFAAGGGLANAEGIEFGPDGNLYVCSGNTRQVLRYSGQTGKFMDVFVSAACGGLDGPQDVKFAPDGSLLVTGWNSNNVLRYSGATGEFLNQLASSSALDGPTHILLAFAPPGVPGGPGGPALYYSFDSRGDKVTDLSGKGNHGTVHGATWTAKGKVGGAYEFDGKDDYIELGPSSLHKSKGQLSACAWVNIRGKVAIVLSNYHGGGAYTGQFFFACDDAGGIDVLFGQGPNACVRYISKARSIPRNEWHHVAFSYDEGRGNGNRIRLYLDGEELGGCTVQSEGNGGPVLDIAENLRIMAHRDTPTGTLSDGLVDEVMMFDRALSGAEVAAICGGRAAREKSSVLHPAFDRNEGGKVASSTGGTGSSAARPE